MSGPAWHWLHEPEKALQACVAALKCRGVIVLPTETVYGVAARAADADAVARLRAWKGRAGAAPFQVLAADADSARPLAEWPGASRRMAECFWPGPLTLVLPAAPDGGGLAPCVFGPDGTVGIRCPAHEFARALIRAVGPLAASSANRAGQPPPSTPGELRSALGDDAGVDAVAVQAMPAAGAASTVAKVDADGRVTVLRQGTVPLEALQRL